MQHQHVKTNIVGSGRKLIVSFLGVAERHLYRAVNGTSLSVPGNASGRSGGLEGVLYHRNLYPAVGHILGHLLNLAAEAVSIRRPFSKVVFNSRVSACLN